MAKFVYEIRDRNDRLLQYAETKQDAMTFIKKAKEKLLKWNRYILIEKSDFEDSKQAKTYSQYINKFDIFIPSDDQTWISPWAGKAKMIAMDDKYELWWTDRFKYENKEGFFLVEINAKVK